MNMMRSKQLLITVGISILFCTGFFVQNVDASEKTYPADGIWEDTFANPYSLKYSNCHVKGGEIVLTQELSHITYDFAQKNHEAYAYQSFFFFPFWKFFSPQNHLSRETQFGGNDVFRIKSIDDAYAERSSRALLFAFVVHHFRFKFDIDPEAVDNVNLIWYGKADDSSAVNFYYYNSSYLLRGGWEILGRNTSENGNDFSVNYTIQAGALKYAIDSSGYIDISVVAHHPLSRRLCTLSTNYVSLLAQSESGYSLDPAYAETRNPIDPTNISKTFDGFYWELLTWDDYQPSTSEARYHVLYSNSTGDHLVEDAVLPGNHNGFSSPPIYLNNLSNLEYTTKYNKLKIRVNLSTDSPSVSPRIFYWALTWQNASRWQDSFNTYYRIDKRTKIDKENETLLISSIQDEWPFFGFDSGNTRASTGKGATTNNLYWFSGEYVGGGFRNPVIGYGNVYIVSPQQSLHQYSVLLPTGINEGDPQVNTTKVSFDYNIVNSPAVTDNTVIIATGQKAPGGHENHIYAYDTDNLTFKWDFSFGQNICYDASPIIVGDVILISTWGGDNGSYILEKNRYTNNKLLAINLQTGDKLWEYSLTGPSYSTPAATSEMVIVGCGSTENDSVVALTLNGDKLWSQQVGSIGHAAPIISEDTVFVTCTQVAEKKSATKIVAMNINDGTILWNKTLGTPSLYYSNVADSTPALYDKILYVASADGIVYALYGNNGTTKWSKEIYTVPLFSDVILQSSPAYADNHVYIGTPAGKIYSLDATSGSSTWEYETFPEWTAAPVLGSPVISNGLVFIADERGTLYSLGKFTVSTKEVSGSIVSEKIRLPAALWWDSFYADMSISNISHITFKLLDENGNVIKEVTNKTSLVTDLVLERTIRLQADFTTSNITINNPQLFRWYITLKADTQIPFMNSSSFTPDPGGWLQKIVPLFTIKVKDNNTGLRIKSATYTLEYTINNVSQKSTGGASCTGKNGTTDWQTLSINISTLPNFDNITSLRSLRFNISDLAGNVASKIVTLKQDVKKPTSSIKILGMKTRYNSSSIRINATASDNGTLNVDASGIKKVELYYRYSQRNNFSGDWEFFANSTRTSPSWLFNFSKRSSQQGGYFELCTIATDNAKNVEDFPIKGDISFVYDWKAPELPSYSGDTLWFKEQPEFSVAFEDDFRLDTIQYRPNFDSVWTTIASRVNASIYDTDTSGHAWSLKEDYWDQMQEDEIYYLYFRINDTLGNTLLVLNNNQAIIIRKDTVPPVVNIDIPSVETDMSWERNFTISGFGNDHNGSGIKEAVLYYRYSEDKSNWTKWTSFGQMLDSSPFEWDFDALEGDGYYEMKIVATDYAGNEMESEVFPLAVASFPTTLALALVGLIVVLVLLSVIIYLKWRRKESSS